MVVLYIIKPAVNKFCLSPGLMWCFSNCVVSPCLPFIPTGNKKHLTAGLNARFSKCKSSQFGFVCMYAFRPGVKHFLLLAGLAGRHQDTTQLEKYPNS
ncbi:hypothetical protein XENTR_v10018468 [Xenopus tropicalis]|nr:hypothetical protein XENTR_v10018468 [Xenopus tropicalis]